GARDARGAPAAQRRHGDAPLLAPPPSDAAVPAAGRRDGGPHHARAWHERAQELDLEPRAVREGAVAAGAARRGAGGAARGGGAVRGVTSAADTEPRYIGFRAGHFDASPERTERDDRSRSRALRDPRRRERPGPAPLAGARGLPPPVAGRPPADLRADRRAAGPTP